MHDMQQLKLKSKPEPKQHSIQHSIPPPNLAPLIIITVSFPHTLQLVKLSHVAATLHSESNVTWVVAEDSALPSPAVAQMLSPLNRTGFTVIHIAHGPTRRGGNAQRNVALTYVRDARLPGVVYNFDDDNAVHPRLWDRLRHGGTGRVGVLAVRRAVWPPPRCDGLFTGSSRTAGGQRSFNASMRIDRPIFADGAFQRFDAGWCDRRQWLARKRGARKYCVDMGGFAFDADLLQNLSDPVWKFERVQGGESEFIDSLIPGVSKLQDLAPNQVLAQRP